jgi:hypothetical protein
MHQLIGPFLSACVLLVVGGLLKVRDPHDTVRALRGAGIPMGRASVRAVGLFEAVVATGAALTGNRFAVGVVGLSYLTFAAFVTIALVRHLPIASCGCLGRADTPPSVAHIAVDIAAFSTAAALAISPAGSLRSVVAHQPLGGVPLLLLAGATAYLVSLVIGPLAILIQAPRPEAHR